MLVKTIDELDSYLWCGHAVLMGKQELSGQSVDEVLLLFGQRKKSARQKYREFVIDGIKHGAEMTLSAADCVDPKVSSALANTKPMTKGS